MVRKDFSDSYAITTQDSLHFSASGAKTIFRKGCPVYLEDYNPMVGGYFAIASDGEKRTFKLVLYDGNFELIPPPSRKPTVKETLDDLTRDFLAPKLPSSYSSDK